MLLGNGWHSHQRQTDDGGNEPRAQKHSSSLATPRQTGPTLTDMRSLVLVATLVALGTVACNRTDSPSSTAAPREAPWPVKVEAVPLPPVGHTDSPQMTASDHGIILSWIEHRGGTAYLRFARRAAAAWSDTQTVASGGDWFLSWADVPTVLRLSTGTLVANWYRATNAAIEAYDVLMAYSTDTGKTWTRPFSPHTDMTTTQHGFVSMVELPDTSLGLLWLDGREQELNKADPEGGAMALYYGRFDSAWALTNQERVDARVCECCPTAAVATPEGVLTAFRDRSPREIRDINVSRLTNGTWTSARPVHVDNWMIEACPVNGAALSARGQDVAIAWFTAKDDLPRAFVAFSTDSGSTWGQPIRLDDESTLGHVDIELLDDGSAAVSWVEFAEQRSSLRLRRVEPDGGRSAAIPVTPARVTGHPRLARSGKELVLAWTESVEGIDDTPEQVKGALVRLP